MKQLFTLRPEKYRILAWIWTHLVFFACCIPGKELPQVRLNIVIGLDKIVHGIFFFFFYVLWSLAPKLSTVSPIILLILSLIFGVFIEFYQFNFVDGRGFELADIYADFIGAVLGFLAMHFYVKPMLVKTKN